MDEKFAAKTTNFADLLAALRSPLGCVGGDSLKARGGCGAPASQHEEQASYFINSEGVLIQGGAYLL